MVVALDQSPERYFKPRIREPYIFVLGKAGQMVLWYQYPPLGEVISGSRSPAGDGVITTISGDMVSTLHPTLTQFFPEALSEVSRRIAFEGKVPGKNRSTGIYWASFDFSTVEFVSELDGSGGCDWSPAGQSLTYEKGGYVYVYDTRAKNSKQLGPGVYPTWSPNGKWIGSLGGDSRAHLMTTEGAPVHWAVEAYKPTPNSAIEWSSNGRYVAFTEAKAFSIPLFGTDYKLMVTRLSDGQTISVADLSSFKTGYTRFYWIVDYKDFCRDCPYN